MAEHVAAGDRCFVEEEYEDAVVHYTKAIEIQPSADVYQARANANIKLEKYMDAVQDAGKAIELDSTNAKAYLRKGTASFFLEEYETALQCFEHGQQLMPDNSQFRTWIRKCKAELDGETEVVEPPAAKRPAGSSPAAAPLATPATSEPVKPAAAPPAAAAAAAAAPSRAATSGAAEASSSQALAPAASEAFTGKYRHQWYQIGSKVVVDVYAKNQSKDAVTVQLTGDDNHLRVCIAAQPGTTAASSSSQPDAQQQQQQDEDYVLELDLFSKVVPDQIKVEVLKTKVEIGMVKAQANVHWPSLEKSAKGPAAAGVAAATVAQQGPPRQYPSSKPIKDWSKVEAEVKELEEKGELDDADPLGAFFKKIFAQGDEDTRRAMMKSFVESNGTVLSTNWKEVGAKKIECTPPEGAELHKWNE